MKKILSLIALVMLCVTGANAQTTLIDYPTSKDGTAISGTTTETTVKIHTNKDAVACYSLKNGYTTSGEMNGNHIKLTTEGGFKKGDVITVAGAINNADETKWGTVVLFSADAEEKTATKINDFEKFINSRLVESDPIEQTYTLETDFDALYLGRNGSTATNVTLIKVVRPEQSVEPVEPTNKTIVLVPGVWATDGATFAAYVWNEDGNAWIPFAAAGDNYATKIPDTYTGLVVTRINPAGTDEDPWKNVWNQTTDIDFTTVADGSVITITGWGQADYTITNPLQEAREKLGKIITMAEMLDAEALATEITAAKEAVAGTDIEAMQNASNALMNKAMPIASQLITDAKAFAESYGYSDVSNAISAVEAAIVPAMSGNFDALEAALNNLTAVAIPAAQDAIGKFKGYAEVLDNEALNAAVANAETALAAGKFKDIIAAIKAAEEPFMVAAKNFAAKVQEENIEDAGVQAALAAYMTAVSDNPTAVKVGVAVQNLINAYNAYQREQNPTFTVAGTKDLTGYEWDTTKNEMKLNSESGLYEWTAKLITVTNDQKPEFKVVRNGATATWYPENNWVITPEVLSGEGVYSTITITFNAETTEIGVSGVKRAEPVFAANNVYYWESPDGYQDQNGGVAVHNNGGRVNYAQAGFYTISLNGKADFSTDVVTITLNEGNTLKSGDEIAITAFRNKDAADKTSGAKLKFDDGSTITTGDGKEFVNINAAVEGTNEYGTEPNTVTITAPETAEGSKTITMTRSNTGTNLFITKIEINRPTSTGISSINAAAQNAVIYNMAGQRVQNAQKGLYIINGKKVVMK